MAKYKCDKCEKSFDKKLGLDLHSRRKHTAAGKTWGEGKSKRKSKSKKRAASITAGNNVREKIRSILVNHPDGLQVKDLITKLKDVGYRPAVVNASGHISQMCSKDSGITRVERGVYRLKNIPTRETKSAESASIEPTLTVQALLVRVEHLEKERDALRGAHLMFVREVGA